LNILQEAQEFSSNLATVALMLTQTRYRIREFASANRVKL
jgi:hypothetical protein